MRITTFSGLAAVLALTGCMTVEPPVKVEPLTTAQWTAVGKGICALRGYELTESLVQANVPNVTGVTLWDNAKGAVIEVNGNDQIDFWGLVNGRITGSSGYNYAGADRSCL